MSHGLDLCGTTQPYLSRDQRLPRVTVSELRLRSPDVRQRRRRAGDGGLHVTPHRGGRTYVLTVRTVLLPCSGGLCAHDLVWCSVKIFRQRRRTSELNRTAGAGEIICRSIELIE
jgi:hypothetical protein